MLTDQDKEEFITVRVQDPRQQNEGSWNSFIDFSILLHTNSKAFTAKMSCVRRRYSEFDWLKKKLQKNAGLVNVPELPGKNPFYSFSNSDFIEKRRKGLQNFLEQVLQKMVLLSDSHLHLFLQTQLSATEIETCVQGKTPYTVTDAIMNYAMSSQHGIRNAEATLSPAVHFFVGCDCESTPDLLACDEAESCTQEGRQLDVIYENSQTDAMDPST
ncbi:sorting nexin-11 [Protopterus annectens]|uniref:sorting nexin-11 n=1 Tax=Protopterus annectens TaxID=7888 RepID=UPI001CFBD5E5|nr:sorting nexin-11 [Protopterus annectens]XP_043911251.1 sorting nexin-11 [Protopterus annectens]XP_043911252.1 sorting nexin-11 [Protopterus annectens]XP_043911253.1 sorting nexin-11 [Protopterus annectens]